tara:strand:+ start:36 stop:1151 length:1116 start_codon:yes stop_codon:yes gene_type:complete
MTKGGAERVAVDLANASVQDGHEVTLIAGWKVDETVLRVQLDPAVTVIYMTENPRGIVQRYAAALYWVMKNRRWIAGKDVLHLHLTQASLLGTLVYYLRNLTGGAKPALVETYHSVGMKIPNRVRAVHAWNCKHRDALALMALDTYWRAFTDHNPKLAMEFIPNGVDTPVGPATAEETTAYLAEIGMPAKARRIIGTVGQFRPSRQPETIARILIDVLKETPDDVHALMCGAGSEYDKVKALVDAEGMADRFILPGVVNVPRVAMSAMSIYLTINVGRITGIAALEAAFCAVPVVALQVDPDCEPDEADWIWSSSSPKTLSQHMISLLKDNEECTQTGERQHAHAVAKYSVKTMRREYVALYRRVVENRRK